MKYYKIEYLPRPVIECNKIEKNGGTIIPIRYWSKVPGPEYYDAYNWVLEDLKTSPEGKLWKEKFGRPLGITDILSHLRIHVIEDERFKRPPIEFHEFMKGEIKGGV